MIPPIVRRDRYTQRPIRVELPASEREALSICRGAGIQVHRDGDDMWIFTDADGALLGQWNESSMAWCCGTRQGRSASPITVAERMVARIRQIKAGPDGVI